MAYTSYGLVTDGLVKMGCFKPISSVISIIVLVLVLAAVVLAILGKLPGKGTKR